MAAPLPLLLDRGVNVTTKQIAEGWRVLAYKNATGVRLISRNGRDLTRRFPELATAVAGLAPPTLVLDGECRIENDPRRELIRRG